MQDDHSFEKKTSVEQYMRNRQIAIPRGIKCSIPAASEPHINVYRV